jgi:hypothetical protein
MGARHSAGITLAVATLVVFALAGCATTADTTTGTSYASDSRIASDVRARLTADSAADYTRVGVTSSGGTVYLTGTVDSFDRAGRAARLAGEVGGVRNVVNNLRVATVAAPARTVTVITPATGVTVTPAAPVAPGQPPVDASGIVARYDAQTGIVTFQDGRAVRLSPSSAVWGPASVAALQPGAQVFVRDAQPVGFTAVGADAGVGSWRMGTVHAVDAANGLIYLADGAVVRVAPTTALRSGHERIGLGQLRPGSQIAIGLPVPPAPPVASAPSGSALPRQAVVPLESPEIQVFVVPRCRAGPGRPKLQAGAGRRGRQPAAPACDRSRERYSRKRVSLSGSQPGVALTRITNGSLPACSKLCGTRLGMVIRSPGPTWRVSSPRRAWALPRTT